MNPLKNIFFVFLIFTGVIFNAGKCFSDGVHHKSVVIDTDMGLDDLRALIWLIKMHDLEIEGIITSDGAMDPIDGMDHLKIILEYYNKREILISSGNKLDASIPTFRQTVQAAFSDFSSPGGEFNLQAREEFFKTLTKSFEDHSMIYICLGPLSNLNYAINNNPGFIDKIDKVMYAGDEPFNKPNAWNTERDKDAAEKIFDTYVNIYEFDISGKYDQFVNADFISAMKHSSNDVALLLQKIHHPDKGGNHIFLYDDIIPINLQFPELFTFKETDYGKSLGKIEIDLLRSLYIDFIEKGNILPSRPSVVFSKYPIDKVSFEEDVALYTEQIISTHGLEEWKAAILTNEMHRHLGAYSLIGVKMGILARELLEADLDEMTVVSFSGLNPPKSCFTDGLQVSTGASLGRGTIFISDDPAKYPKAIFIKDPQKIRIELRPEIMKKIQSEIENISNEYGYGSIKYFKEIRRISIKYWLNLNRRHMFEVYDEITGEKIM